MSKIFILLVVERAFWTVFERVGLLEYKAAVEKMAAWTVAVTVE